MTKYDPFKGMKPYRGRRKLTRPQRQKWGAVAAGAFGLYMYNRVVRGEALLGGTSHYIEFTQPAVTTLTEVKVPVERGGNHVLQASHDKNNPLHITAYVTNAEQGHTVLVAPVINGDQELSNSVVATTDINGIASITFSAEDMGIIGSDGRTSVKFKFVVDGDYTTPIMVECPIGA